MPFLPHLPNHCPRSKWAGWNFIGALLCALLAPAISSQTVNTSASALESYRLRSYEATWQVRQGSKKATMKTSLKPLANTDDPQTEGWEAQANIRILLFHLNRKTQIRRVNDIFQPLQVEHSTGSRSEKYFYDWDSGTLFFTSRKQKYHELELVPGAREDTTLEMEVAAALAEGGMNALEHLRQKQLVLPARSARVWQQLVLQLSGPEQVQVGAGEFETMLLRFRDSEGKLIKILWLAPALNWVVVRAVEYDAKGRRGVRELQNFRFTNEEG